MTKTGDQEPSENVRRYYPETQVLIDSVRVDPKHDFRCSLGDGDGAVGIYEVPGGCVALPGVNTQTVCAQHRITDGSFNGMHLVVDLSVDGGWSRHFGEQPDYYIVRNADTEEHTLVEFDSLPFEVKAT